MGTSGAISGVGAGAGVGVSCSYSSARNCRNGMLVRVAEGAMSGAMSGASTGPGAGANMPVLVAKFCNGKSSCQPIFAQCAFEMGGWVGRGGVGGGHACRP